MKFRFCGDGDCPDWILAQINANLSVLSSVKLKILTQIVAKSIITDEINESKVRYIFGADSSPDLSKSAFSCLRFLLISATRYNTQSGSFEAELQQLGLPKEHAAAVSRVLNEFSDEIKSYLMKNNLRINEFTGMTWEIAGDAIDCGRFSFEIKNQIQNGVPRNNTHTVNIHKHELKVLINELKTVKSIMEKYDHNKFNKV